MSTSRSARGFQKHWFGQSGYLTSGGAVVLGAPSDVLVIDASY